MTKPCGSGDTVNEAVVQWKFTLLNRVPSGKFNGVNVLIRGRPVYHVGRIFVQ